MKLTKFFSILQTVALLLFILVLGMSRLTSQTLPGQFRVVVSGSMEPAIETGSLIFSWRTDHLKVGDVISFEVGDQVVTHRIEQMQPAENTLLYTTKGDGNQFNDPSPIEEEAVLGKVLFSIPKLGNFILLCRTPAGSAALVLTLIQILLVLEFLSLLNQVQKENHKGEVVDG